MTAYSAYKSNDDGEFLAEISRRVTEWSDVVINRLRFAAVKNGLVASFDNDLTTVLNAEQQKQACLVETAGNFGALAKPARRGCAIQQPGK